MNVDDELLAQVFAAEGSSELAWEVSTRCSCYSDDSHQPKWGHPVCGGLGVVYATPATVRGLFRSQSRWVNWRESGELDHGEATLTVPIADRPGYTDHRVRDRYTVIEAVGDIDAGRVFYPAGPASPFMFGNQARAWRVQLQSLEQQDRVQAQP